MQAAVVLQRSFRHQSGRSAVESLDRACMQNALDGSPRGLKVWLR